MSPKLFNTTVLVLAIACGVLLLEPWGGSDRTEASPDDVGALTQAERDEVAAEQGFYPPAPSTAEGMTPEWQEFADEVDRICAVTYNDMVASQAQVEAFGSGNGWSKDRVEEALMRLSANQGLQIVYYTEKLGEPAERPGLFYRWRAMVAERAGLRSRAAEAAGEGQWGEYHRLCDRNAMLKDRGDVIGQSFGLRICTSN